MIFLCQQIGLKTAGVPVEQSDYLLHRYYFWKLRELGATLAAYLDVYIRKPTPILGTPEPIFAP